MLISLRNFQSAVPHEKIRKEDYKHDERREVVCSTRRSHHIGTGLVSFLLYIKMSLFLHKLSFHVF